MLNLSKSPVRRAALGSLALALVAAASPGLAAAASPQLLLSVDFAPRTVTRIEVGDFHFRPGQVAPVHTHAAPAIGYVSKGTILYQVEGMPAQVLKAGDAFYEPVGPRILHFDNASATEEAVFTDFNLEQTGEPFIVFPKPPTEKIDRRTFPSADVPGALVTRAEAYATTLPAGKARALPNDAPVSGYVAVGTVSVTLDGQSGQTVRAGHTFYAPAGHHLTVVPKGGAARVVTFAIR